MGQVNLERQKVQQNNYVGGGPGVEQPSVLTHTCVHWDKKEASEDG